jgi:hypothetical protein
LQLAAKDSCWAPHIGHIGLFKRLGIASRIRSRDVGEL